MPKGAKKRAKLKKKQQGGQPAGSNGGAATTTTTTNNNGSNNSSHGDAASDGNHLPIKLNIPPVDASEDSMESSEEMMTPRAEVAEEERKGAASEVPVERAVEVADEGATGEAGQEVMVDALPPEATDREHEGKADVTAEAHAVVQEPEVQDVMVSEAPEVLEPEVRNEEVVVVGDTAKVHPAHQPETKTEEVVVRDTDKAAVVREPEAKGEVSRSREPAPAQTTEVVRGPAVAVAAAGHRAKWWNCCGILEVFAGSER